METKYFERAIELARNGVGFVSPNPAVGCVIVKGGEIVGEGWHRKAGYDHAEIIAMNDAGDVSGAEMYVTLEPCCHAGKTGPCCETIVEAGIGKVFVGMEDPNKKVSGNGIKFLRENGVEVEILDGDLAREIRMLNQPFIKMMKVGLPYVTLKAGISKDGKITDVDGKSALITCEEAREDAYLERSMCDAVLVGAGTVIADDSELAVHGKYKGKNLLRVILDKDLECDSSKRVFRDGNVFVSSNNGADVDIRDLLEDLASKGVQSVFVEGGSHVHASFYSACLEDRELVDCILLYISPNEIGGDALPVVAERDFVNVADFGRIVEEEPNSIGVDLKTIGYFNLY